MTTITNNRITQLSLEAAEAAVERAMKQNREGLAAWNPVYADVVDLNGITQGHIASDGYLHKTWSFYPRSDIRLAARRYGDSYRAISDQKKRLAEDPTLKLRRQVRGKTFESVVPKWIPRYSLGNIRTGVESK